MSSENYLFRFLLFKIMKIEDICTILERFAPPQYQEDYDNAGLTYGDKTAEVTGVLCSVDVTEEVIEEAIVRNCNMIVSHHPLIFRGLKSLTGTGRVERCLLKAIENHIALYACHTNLDKVKGGVSWKMAQKIGLEDVSFLAQDDYAPERGLGVVGNLKETITKTEALQLVKRVFKCSDIRYVGKRNTINRIALCGGSGSDLINAAREKDADMYVTSDCKYHELMDAADEMIVASIGHYESEQYTKEVLRDEIIKKIPNFAAYISERNINPIKHF